MNNPGHGLSKVRDSTLYIFKSQKSLTWKGQSLKPDINFTLKSTELIATSSCCSKSFVLLRAGLKNHF